MVGAFKRSKTLSTIFSILSVVVLMFSMFLPQSKVHAEVMDREVYTMDWSYSNQLGKSIRTELIKTASGQIAYCLTHGLKSPNGQDLPEIGKTDDIVYRVLLNGYPQKSPSDLGVSNWEEAHYATQLALWNALGQLSVSELQHHNGNVEKASKAIINAANQSQDTQEIHMNVVPTEEQKATLNGDYFETNLYTVKTNAKKGTFTIQTNNAPQGVKIVNENGEVKNQLSIGEKFRIQIPKNTSSGKFNLKVISNLSNLQAIAYKGTDTIQNATVLLERGEEKVSSDLSVNWESIGALKIKKTGGNNEALLGAVFEVSNSNNEKVGTITTDKDGIATLSNLPIGTYTVKEVKAPEGHILSDNTQTIEVKTGETATIQVKNESIKGNIEIKKLSDSGKILPGVEFTIFKEDGTSVTKVTTNKDGIAKVDGLTFGKYYFQESKALDGYVLNTTKYPFEVKEHNKTLTFEVTNQGITGNLEITKVDVADGNNKLPNAEFTIFNEQGKEVVKGKTNAEGIAKFEKLPFGKYTYRETLAPEGYILNEETFSFEIKENGQIIKHIVKDEKIPSIKTTATDKTDGTKEMHTSKSVTIQDKVEYKDLQVGKEYTVKGKLMDKETNKPLVVNGKEVTAETKFTPKEANGSITLDFTFDATGLEEKEVVVFEDLIKDGKVVTTHADINDKGQTVKFVKPEVKTTATNKTDGGKEIHANESITIQDKVEYTNLVVGKEYTVKGKLMNKATNEPLLIDGKEVTAETKFTSKEKNGFVTLDFTFDGREQQGREVVVFEDLLHEGQVIATHADINDVGQTVRFVEPSIKTTATNKTDGSKELDASKSVTIQDKVEYKDLIVGKEYVVKGKLMDKATNKPLLVDGKEVTAESKFTTKEKNGSITLDFTFNASELQGKEVVVFEELYQDNVLVAIHVDIEDMGQTVKFKEKKPEKPQPEQPQPEQPTKPDQPKPQPEQPTKSEQPKTQPTEIKQTQSNPLPQTGGTDNSMKYKVLGISIILLGGLIFVLARRKKHNS
ncbi:VaFE repeat-containing surface-anchored protein [Bacillus thuringiensis]|uniref:VaFE repeat-containing surface-anchored protein n=4 Tax=Bacillus thuringiensis TaxID=1428 RepID=UPI002AB83F40|nr:VaFE repeat-containing surface-anchored protein [Bacillus thuringiensis]MDZ3956270.1 VaFE repeat-containing surface-anchored protein [Bacillus thuringiensis]